MDANGLTAIDSTGIQLGNDDIECTWQPPTHIERAPLPGHEHAAPLFATWGNLKETDHVR